MLLEQDIRQIPVILLQIVMVSPGTNLVKNHESQSKNNESSLKKNESEIENVWAFTLYYNILKLKYSPSILKRNKR